MKNVWKYAGLKTVWNMIPALILGSVLLGGCAFANRGMMTELQADENGKLVHTIVEKADKSFEIGELEQYVKDEIASYSGAPAETSSAASDASDEKSSKDSAGSAGIELQSCRIKDGNVQIRIDYDSYEDYMRFNGTRCFFGTIEDAGKEGYAFDGTFLNEKGKPDEEANASIQERASEWKVLIVEEPMRVRVPDKILYTSENMETTGRTTAVYNGEKTTETASSVSESASASSKTASSASEASAKSSSGKEEKKQNKKKGAFTAPEQFVIDDFDLAYVVFK